MDAGIPPDLPADLNILKMILGFYFPQNRMRIHRGPYSTVTALARFRGWSTSSPRITAMW